MTSDTVASNTSHLHINQSDPQCFVNTSKAVDTSRPGLSVALLFQSLETGVRREDNLSPITRTLFSRR